MGYIKKILQIDERKILIWVFLAALALRVLVVLSLPAEYRIPKIAGYQFDNIAVNFLSGKGFVLEDGGFIMKSWRTPVYPLFLALVYSIFGHNYSVVLLLQCILSAFLCIIIYYIAKNIFDKGIALVSAFALAVYPPYVYNRQWGAGFLDSEVFFCFFFMLFILFLTRRLFVQLNFKNSLISGILLGFLALTKPFVALFPPFLFVLLLCKVKFSISLWMKKIIPFIFGFVIIITPWAIRNYVIHKAFVPLSTEGGLALYGSNNPYANGGGLIILKPLFPQSEWERILKMSEIQQDKLLRGHAKIYLLKNYKRIPGLAFKKLLVQWDMFLTDYDIDEGRRYNIYYAIVLMFGAIGIAISVRKGLNINNSLLFSLLAYSSFIAVIFAGDQRLRYSFEPLLIIFASSGIFGLYGIFKNRLLLSAIVASVVGINLAFYIFQNSFLCLARRALTYLGI